MRLHRLTAALLLLAGAAQAAPPVIRVGVMNDMSGPYSDNAGRGSVAAAQMAIDEFTRAHPDIHVELLTADHLNKPDVGSALARSWIDVDRIDAIFDIANSAVALAVNDLARGTHTALIASSAATSDLTGPACSPNTVQWTYDTWAVAHTLAQALHNEGARSWFVIASDNALGKSLVGDTIASAGALGDRVLGRVFTPINSSDYSATLLNAGSSNADVVAFATAGGDTVALIKQSAEFGMRQPGKLFAALLATTNDVKAAGLDAAQGLLIVQPFYADLNAASRAWAAQFASRDRGRMPTAFHAGVYGSVKAYLEAAASAGSTDGPTVVAAMKRAHIHDDVFGDVVVRPDGRATHTMYLFRVKAPTASIGPDDLLERVETLTGEQAFRPIAQGGCNLDQMR